MIEELIPKIKNGDNDAFRTLYDYYYNDAMYSAVGITRNREYSMDAVQETFIRVYTKIHKYDVAKPFSPWFYRILINECNRILKKNTSIFRRQTYLVDDICSDISTNYRSLYEDILGLKNMYRIPIILKYIHGFTEKEIANILKLNQNTVKSRLYKGREKLRNNIDECKGVI